MPKPIKTGDADLEKYAADFLFGLYRDMIRTRVTDDRIEALYKQGQLTGGCFSSLGQEACSVGSTASEPLSRSSRRA